MARAETSHPHRRYTALFSDLPAWNLLGADTEAVLQELAWAMRDTSGASPQGDNPAIPAGYTYFGQLVSHDLSHAIEAAGQTRPENTRTPQLDLECIYGLGPASRPELYARSGDNPAGQHRYLLRTGATEKPQFGSAPAAAPSGCPFDLPRVTEAVSDPDGRRCPVSTDPIIADPRNDFSLMIAQMHLLFCGLHNRAAALVRDDVDNGAEAFALARRFIVACYRDIICFDYLKRILRSDLYDDFLAPRPRWLRPRLASPSAAAGGRLAAEFVFAAGRAGHAMVRNKYVANDILPTFPGLHSLDTMLDFSGFEVGRPGTRGSLPLPADWVVDWCKFFGPGAQPSRRFKPFIAHILANRRFGRHDDIEGGLIYFDLLRSFKDPGLPSGQAFAQRLSRVLGPEFACPVLTGDAMLPRRDAHASQPSCRALTEVFQRHPALKSETPLFYYVLQEADVLEDGARLGPVGSFITALTFRRLLPAPRGRRPRAVAGMDEFISLRDLDDDAFKRRVLAVGGPGVPAAGPDLKRMSHSTGGFQHGQHRSQ